jgi:hypothetical protein
MSRFKNIPSLGDKVVDYDYRCYGRIDVIFESGKVITIPVTLEEKEKFMKEQEMIDDIMVVQLN